MTFALIRRGQPPRPPAFLAQRNVPRRLHDLAAAAECFQIDDDLAEAVNVALAVGAPLLLTGEPGTGKTQLAYYLAWQFGLQPEQPFTLEVKSNSAARDLLYRFDTVAYFHEAQRRDGARIDKQSFIEKGPLWRAFAAIRSGKPAIVLIDEIDKAPRDFPNDLLHELDQYSFRVAETGEVITADRNAPPPVVVVTSNSEKRLPDAFLRRCVVHRIEFSEEVLRDAVAARRELQKQQALSETAQRRFLEVRRQLLAHQHKPPATAEFLVWLAALQACSVRAEDLAKVPTRELPLLSALVKDSSARESLG
ncbi:MoxR family ATPase [Nannocystis sp. RBIL2]|uniref:AAA family ATPase n=1 Tax=Nannocystis sp. RBIL2 TaxID=2996788 RepID=UPI0022719533|nr:MoxR family ATPase [Nannocystis sp. RBIL2]MCY1066760.1 MoxR family ATPase [Nannocystis sp. RBIL2]